MGRADVGVRFQCERVADPVRGSPDGVALGRASHRRHARSRDSWVAAKPTFPRGIVMSPGTSLSLPLFEDRYQPKRADVLTGDQTFGVVLIGRGPAVGSGDTRSPTGTLPRSNIIRSSTESGMGSYFVTVRTPLGVLTGSGCSKRPAFQLGSSCSGP